MATYYGTAGNDTITGGPGADFITGAGGNDTLAGGTGADTFAMRVPSGSVTITDFSHAQGDTIDLSALGSYGFSDIQAAATGTTNTVITLGALTITVSGVAPGSLQTSDFVLGSITVFPTDDFAIDAAVTISSTSGPLVQFTGSGGTLTNHGTMTSTFASGITASFAPDLTAVFQNDGAFSVTATNATGVGDHVALDNSGTFAVTGTVGSSFTQGVSGDLVNSGTMTVVADQGIAVGGDEDSVLFFDGSFRNLATGTLSVSALAGSAYGFEVASMSGGASFDNAGHVIVSGIGHSVGLAYVTHNPSSVLNSGTITVTDADGVGVSLASLLGATLNNSGTITAATAVASTAGAINLVNTGIINGIVKITGLSDGNVLDSHAGTINGAVLLSCSCTVTLGAEDNTVQITTSGINVVDGGGGTNTISFASTANGVTVSLALQGQAQNTSGGGVATLINIQNLIGSAREDTLTGGSGTNTLTGGAGADTFAFAPGGGAETVTDFSHGDADRIDLSAFHNLYSVKQVLADAAQVGSNTVISFGGETTITLNGAAKASLLAGDFILATPPPTTTANTFDGGPSSAVAFRNTATGDLGYMTANALGGQTWHPIGPSSTDYSVIAKGDFNGDGLADIAFRSNLTGDWGYMSINPAGGEVWHAVGATSLAYAALGSGDFNGDGHTDIAFRNTATGAWGFMTPKASGGEIWHDVGATSTTYDAVGLGDFDGAGRADIAFRNPSTGDFGYMAVSPSGAEVWHPIGPTGADYAAVGFGDFNGDGVLDVAFRQTATGDWGFMTVNPGGGETWHGVGPSSTAYAVIGSADYDGDGMTDLAFRSGAGDWGFMALDGSGHQTWHAVGATGMSYTPL